MTKISVEIDAEDIGLLFTLLGNLQDEERRQLSIGSRNAKAKAKELHEEGKKLWRQIQSTLLGPICVVAMVLAFAARLHSEIDCRGHRPHPAPLP
jgi:hypothetical protein